MKGGITISKLWSRPVIKRDLGVLASLLLSLKEKFAQKRVRAVPLDTSRPRLRHPKGLAVGSFHPPRYFSRGSAELNRKKNPEPIRYLMTESLEEPLARAVPNNSLLIRSLCKGKGVLEMNETGLTYLNVDNRFVSAMMPYLKLQGLIIPPYFNTFGPSVGAHIPVIPKREADFHYLPPVKELGQEFSFEIEGLYSVKPDAWPEAEEVWFFKVHSPELEALRQRHFLTTLPLGHSFHIVAAIQPREWTRRSSRPAPLLRINVAYLAA